MAKESIPPTPSSHATLEARDVATETPPVSGHDASVSPLTATATADNAQLRKEHPKVAPAKPHAEPPNQPPAPELTPSALPGPSQSVPSLPHSAGTPSSEQRADRPASIPDLDTKGRGISPGQAVPAHPGAAPSLEGAEVPPANKTSDILPSPLRPSQPHSPSSSVDPYSNNTPAPPTTSPDTSPADEVTDSVDKIEPVTKDSKSRRPSSLVPSTPDEQLRLEDAQSLKHNTLEASRAIGDVPIGGSPLANEVIQEEVSPLSTVDKDQARLMQQQAASLPPEPQRPDGVVDTEDVAQGADVETKAGPLTPSVLRKAHSAPSAHPTPSQPERMTTRVSSGAIRHKSVSEILGETPKSTVLSHGDRSMELPSDKGTPDSTARMRLKDRKEREKERSKLSTVVFPKQQQLLQQEKNDSLDLVRQAAGDLARVNDEQDYLFTLFQSRAHTPPRAQSLGSLLSSAHKTLSTSNHLVDYTEQMDCRTLRRIYALQHANRWPLRQLKRSVEPPRQGTHWDVLLDHMKWMRTDFREERKWKIAAAKCCAEWCAEYVNSDPEHQALLRVPVKSPPKTEEKKDQKTEITSIQEPSAEALDASQPASHPTPDLVPSAEDESVSDGFNDEPHHDLRDTVAPAAIFSLGSDEFTFSLDMTPAAEKLLDELPIYAPASIAPDTNLPIFNNPPDSTWKTEILPVSKYTAGRIAYRDEEPPRKRSRYDYSQYEDDVENQIIDLPPEQTNVALFKPENRHIRDRIHPGHSFRPPTEHPMPSVGFFESRQSSQWTYAEDDELRHLVKEYSYNWSLISSCLSPPSIFSSGAERRTPWECFERWISLEGLPADMSKTPYFRAYHQRLEAAQRTVLAQNQAAQQQQQQQQQQGNNQQPQLPIRRRTTQPLRVDRRRSSKHFALLDAMRKLAKKRETMLQKQQQASHLASLRKANESNQPKPIISSPAEFSRLKYDREMKLQERHEQYRQQMIAQQRANLAAQRTGQMPNQQSMPNAPGRNPNGMPQNSNPLMSGTGAPNGMPNGMPPGVGANQGRPPMQGVPGGAPVNGQMPNGMGMRTMPQSGMPQPPGARPGMAIQASPENARVIREANRLQEQQRILQSRQQQHQPQGQPQQVQQQFHNQQQFGPQGSNSPNLNMPNGNGAPNNPGMVAALQAGGGMQSPSFHNNPQGVSTPSPRMGQPNPLSSGVVPTISSIQNQIQRSNPNMTPEQVNRLATERLHQYQQQRMSQMAMNAAAGNIGNAQANYQTAHDGNFQSHSQNGVNGGMQVHQSQGYSPMMRVAQNAQQNRVGVGNSPAVNGAVPQQSRSSTPQTQRSGNTQGGPRPGSSKSPHLQQAQIASG